MSYLVSCAPALPKDGISFDEQNDAQCAVTTLRDKTGSEPTAVQYENAIAMLQKVQALNFSAAVSTRMLKILMFSSEIDLFNIANDKDRTAALNALRDDIEAGRMDEVLARIDADGGGYEKSLQSRFDGWVKMCTAAHIDYLIAGAIGTGAFGNDSQKIARAFARAWVKYGKGDFIFCQYSNDKEKTQIFKAAFEEAQKLRVKLLEEEGYETKEIVAALKEGRYKKAEIEQLLKNAGHTEVEIKELLK